MSQTKHRLLKDNFQLRWRQTGEDTFRATAGGFDLAVDYDNDACWTYTIEYGISTVREFGDYIRSFGSKEKAFEAAERWLLKEWRRVGRALRERP